MLCKKQSQLGKELWQHSLVADITTTLEILEKVQSFGICDIANDNSDGQVVISGDLEAVEKAINLSKQYGIKRAVLLPVSAPFHCRLMQPAQLTMEEALNNLEFQQPT